MYVFAFAFDTKRGIPICWSKREFQGKPKIITPCLLIKQCNGGVFLARFGPKGSASRWTEEKFKVYDVSEAPELLKSVYHPVALKKCEQYAEASACVNDSDTWRLRKAKSG